MLGWKSVFHLVEHSQTCRFVSLNIMLSLGVFLLSARQFDWICYTISSPSRT